MSRRQRPAAAFAAAAVTLTGAATATAAPATAAPRLLPTTAELAVTALRVCDGPVTTPRSSPDNLTDAGGMLFFTADDGIHGDSLWRTDGTAGGTIRLKTLSDSSGYYDYSYTELAAVGSTVYFAASGKGGEELWRSDGTREGTVRVKRFADSDDDGYGEGGIDHLTASGDRLFFTADDGTHGEELWRSDGTGAGTVLVKDIQPGSTDGGYYDYGPGNLMPVGDTLFFTADDGTHGSELWRTDGTAAGTVLVKDVRPGSYDSSIRGLAAVGDTLFFTARDGTHGRELWTSDGTEAGTTLVSDVRPGGASANPGYLVDVGGTVFFSADDGVHGRDLWRSDGTEAGTALVKDLAPGDEEYYGAYGLAAVGSTLFFSGDDGSHGLELWRSDGTEAGTVLVKDIRPGDYASYANGLTDVDGELYFTARDGLHGRELWRSDGTEAGTMMVKDIDPSATGYSPRELTASGGVLYFSASDGVHGEELWRSDGTAAGTSMVKDINLGGEIYVSSRGDADKKHGTLRVWVRVDTAGKVVLAPAGEDRLIKSASREVDGEGTTVFTLEPTRAGLRELRKHGKVRVRARFTFTTCGGTVNSVTRAYTLIMR